MQAWPECQDAIADSQCALIRTRDNDLPACFAEARANASRVEQAKLAMAEFNEGESQFKRSINLAKDIESAWNDPRRFIAEKVKTKTEEWITENLLDANGRFTERGQTLAQQTYDFIFNRTTGNAGLFAGNPIIAGIQRSAADQIYRAHSQALHELEGVVNQMGELKVSAPTVLAPRALAPKPRPQNASSGTTLPPPSIVPAECAILDGDARTDLAINDPERYERLVARCRR